MAGVLNNDGARQVTNRRIDRLSDFLAGAATTPFQYGRFDCALMPADWCYLECGIDPAATVRNLYNSDEGWKKLVRERAGGDDLADGLIALWVGLGLQSRLARTDKPRLGDIGLVEVPGHGVFGAISGFHGRWTVKLHSGLVGGYFKVLASWGVPCLRH